MKLNAEGHIWHVDIHQHRPKFPWLVLLHGFMGSGRSFAHLISDLTSFCNPVTIDLPGHGLSSKQSDPDRYASDLLVKGLVSVLSRLQFEPLILFGYSMGGRLALRTACLYPHLASGLILESSSPGIQPESERTERIHTDQNRAVELSADFHNFLDEWHKNSLFSSDSHDSSDSLNNSSESLNDLSTATKGEKRENLSRLKSSYRQMMSEQSPAAMAAVLQGFSPGLMPDSWSLLPTLSLPVCLITGESDTKYRTLAEEMDRLFPNSINHMIQGASHRTHLDNPSEFSKLIQTFIQTLADS